MRRAAAKRKDWSRIDGFMQWGGENQALARGEGCEHPGGAIVYLRNFSGGVARRAEVSKNIPAALGVDIPWVSWGKSVANAREEGGSPRCRRSNRDRRVVFDGGEYEDVPDVASGEHWVRLKHQRDDPCDLGRGGAGADEGGLRMRGRWIGRDLWRWLVDGEPQEQRGLRGC